MAESTRRQAVRSAIRRTASSLALSCRWVVLASVLVTFHALADDVELLALLQSGEHVAVMRHSTAPGSDDPPNFRIGDCSTQRNLSDGGRDLAAEIGEKLRANGVQNAVVASSEWCRCMETAALLNVGDVEALPALNSLINYYGQRNQMTSDVHSWIAQQDLRQPTILVTHQINISALTRSGAGEGDILILKRLDDERLELVGRISAE
jgi:phosphohistidine phosphatase SixA